MKIYLTFILPLDIYSYMTTSIRPTTRRSLIWKISTEELKNIVSESTSTTDILSHFGLRNIGGNYRTLRKRLDEDGIEYIHLPKGIGHRQGKSFPTEKKSLEECFKDIFIKRDGNHSNRHVRDYLKRFELKPYKCEICGFQGMWNNLPLTLQMDHINGDSSDNRLENLRWICPHCHTQTKTFAGRKLKIRYYCDECHEETSGYGDKCIKCVGNGKHKVDRPTKEMLEKEMLESPIETIGEKYGVSGNAIRKWCKSYGIEPSPYGRGYWSKNNL
jgi:predicted RNA-binding Zn-ribbon protein involved in translation (DUF1610 family)